MMLIQRFTCKNCNYSYQLPHKTFAGMNSELYCKQCHSLAFGLIRREVFSINMSDKYKNKKFKFYHDSGHGWLAVKTALLRELGIEDKVSSYSYQKGLTTYLEEDCDAPLFINAWKSKYGDINIVEKNSNVLRSLIRSYDSYIAKV